MGSLYFHFIYPVSNDMSVTIHMCYIVFFFQLAGMVLLIAGQTRRKNGSKK
jgi:hypothetical protein